MQDCSSRRSWTASAGSSPGVPDQPIQTPPARLRIGSIAVANPPALRLVVHLSSSFVKETGNRLDTTMSLECSGISSILSQNRYTSTGLEAYLRPKARRGGLIAPVALARA